MENKEFLSKEQCLSLSELNYDGDYDFVYHATGELWERGKKDKKERFVPAPLKQQVLRWFREKHEIHGFIIHYSRVMFRWCIDSGDDFEESIKLDTYEEAEDGVINKLIKLAKQQDNEDNN
jgi:hypothetical protein